MLGCNMGRNFGIRQVTQSRLQIKVKCGGQECPPHGQPTPFRSVQNHASVNPTMITVVAQATTL
jgi:hypothetical protein